MSTQSIPDIYAMLFAEEIVRVKFATLQERDMFRIQMHQYKKKQEEAMVSIDMAFRQTSFSFLPQETNDPFIPELIVQMQFVPKKIAKQYEILRD